MFSKKEKPEGDAARRSSGVLLLRFDECREENGELHENATKWMEKMKYIYIYINMCAEAGGVHRRFKGAGLKCENSESSLKFLIFSGRRISRKYFMS